jgi:hypothetical protein
MPNWVPFLSISIISVILLGYTIMRNREKSPQIILFWLFISGLGYFFEFIIFIILESYEYNPDILANEYNDSIAGSITSQALAVPVAITSLVVFHLNTRWTLFIIGLFYMIETLFLHLNIYEHNWWKSFYTILFLILAVILSRIWWRFLHEQRSQYVNFATLFFVMMALTETAGWIFSGLLGLYSLPIPFSSVEMKNNIIGNGIYLLFATYLYSLIIYFRSRELPFTIMTLVFLLTIEILMVNQGNLTLKDSYYIFILPAVHITMIQAGKYIYHRHFRAFQTASQ